MKKKQLNRNGIRILSSTDSSIGRTIAQNLQITSKLTQRALRAGDNTLTKAGGASDPSSQDRPNRGRCGTLQGEPPASP
jgi:hypothetical protein